VSPPTSPSVPPGPPEEVEALYRAPLAEFVDARNALAARLRKAGDAEASARVKTLPKPSAAAWALNQVYWRARDDYTRMIAAGDRLRSLQQQMLGGRAADPRDAMQERQAAMRTVVERAVGFLAEAGQPATDATRQRVNVTADALATWGSHPQGYVPGYLDRELEPPGFDALASLGATALRLVKPSASTLSARTEVPAPQTTGRQSAGTEVPALHEKVEAPQQKGGPTPPGWSAAKRPAAKAEQEEARAREVERKRLARALQEAARDAAARRSADERARGVLARATADVEAASKELAALERQLVTVRARVDRAERTRADAQASADAAGRAYEEAEDAVARVRRELDEL
jgi:hypothetical protein